LDDTAADFMLTIDFPFLFTEDPFTQNDSMTIILKDRTLLPPEPLVKPPYWSPDRKMTLPWL